MKQVERTVINSYPLFRIVQQLANVITQWSYTARDTQLAGIQSDYSFEIYEDADDFAPIASDALTSVEAHLPGDGRGFLANLPQ